MANLYLADWHYGHRNIIRYDSRPYFSLDDMNRGLVENWNKAVRPDDTVYVLGDMFWCNTNEALAVLAGLAGRKVLVRGNHDYIHTPEFNAHFETIADYLEILDGQRHVVLCHYPIPCFKNHYQGWYHLYGHVHMTPEAELTEKFRRELEEAQKKPCRMYNVGVMLPYMDYQPRTLDHILRACGEED